MFSIFNFSNFQISNPTKNLIKCGAYKSLIRAEIQQLPVLYKDVFRKMERLKTKVYPFSYQYMDKNYDEPVEYYEKRCGDYGAIFFCGSDEYNLFYNDIWPEDVKNWIFLSLFACVELNLVPLTGIIKFTENMDEIVDDFVYQFIAPDPILNECGIKNATDIAATCCIPLKNALAKSHRIKSNRFREDTAFDITLTYSFKDFIESYK